MKGSMTVEAVFVITLILLIIVWIMQETISLYQETMELAEKGWLEIEKVSTIFRGIFMGKEVLP